MITWDASVDSTVARAHQHAARAAKRGTCEDTGELAVRYEAAVLVVAISEWV
jgi:hypothetical protein